MAGAVDVEERDDVAFGERTPVNVLYWCRELADDAYRNVARNDGEGDTSQPSMMDMNVGSADLRVEDLQ
jgi:hypothetical protein